MSKSAFGLSMEATSALCYIPYVGWMAAVAVLALERDSGVRREAVLSLMTYGVFLGIVGGVVPMLRATGVLAPIGAFVGGLSGVGFLGLWLWMAVLANQGKKVNLPILSMWADKLVDSK